jgi:polyisoprenoid-binding protein YceI
MGIDFTASNIRRKQAMSASTSPKVGTSTWAIDAVHSSVEFAVKHMMVATAKGRFTGISGSIQLDLSNPANSSVEATIDLTTVDTGNAQRDGHLKTDDFFHAEKFANATFRSTRVEVVDDENAKVYGDLTIRDVTKEVVLDVEFEGQGKDAYGKQRAGFTAQFAFNRLDYGIKWNPALETGGFAVSNRVKLTAHIAAVLQD